jgi:hypothetical protein
MDDTQLAEDLARDLDGTFEVLVRDHLDRCHEILGARLNTLHNLHFYQTLMADLRMAIEIGQLEAFAKEFLARQSGPPGAVSEGFDPRQARIRNKFQGHLGPYPVA